MRCLFALIAVAAILPISAFAQDISLLEEGGSFSARTVQLFALVTVLSLAPGIAIMITCFPFLITVLSILRQAIGLQQSPPNMLLVSLALFLTYFIMEPVFEKSWEDGIGPLTREEIEIDQAFHQSVFPFKEFMAARVDPQTFAEVASLRPDIAVTVPSSGAPLSVLIPSFMLSEISRAFQIGFLIYLPFLIIDLVVAAILMSMGMMMVPPAVVSLPFKLAFFVIADGWALIAGSLVRSYF